MTDINNIIFSDAMDEGCVNGQEGVSAQAVYEATIMMFRVLFNEESARKYIEELYKQSRVPTLGEKIVRNLIASPPNDNVGLNAAWAESVKHFIRTAPIDWDATLEGEPIIYPISRFLSELLTPSMPGASALYELKIGIVPVLLQAYCNHAKDCNLCDKRGRTLLEVFNGQEERQVTFSHPKVDIDVPNKHGVSLLNQVVDQHNAQIMNNGTVQQTGRPQLIKELLAQGAQLSRKWVEDFSPDNRFSNFTSYHFVAWKGWQQRDEDYSPERISTGDLCLFRSIGKLDECLFNDARWRGHEDKRADLIMQLRPSFRAPYMRLLNSEPLKEPEVKQLKPLLSWVSKLSENVDEQAKVRA